ncbi:uncharacterized protein LOC120205544 isoform X2 [Hibiscus syriacus]|uniref:uncharacterized protein LOC120205544 isoform X2 n=1 Tax=Hibiscus syriacus TaxID=106335 RepID=UPI001921ECF0|nr:uncharacterized protein LOC120205544 isoform X2 [Hibiscus syriacus]
MMKVDPSNSKIDLVGEDSSIRKNVEETENEDDNDSKKTAENEKSELIELACKAETFVEVEHVSHDSIQHGSPSASENRTNETDPGKAVGSKNSDFDEPTFKCGGLKKRASKRKKQTSSSAIMKADPSNSKNDLVGENSSVRKTVEETENEKENVAPHPAPEPKGSTTSKVEISGAVDESSPVHHGEIAGKSVRKPNSKTSRTNEKSQKVDSNSPGNRCRRF